MGHYSLVFSLKFDPILNKKESSSSFEMDEIELHRNLTKKKESQVKVISKIKPSYDEEDELKL